MSQPSDANETDPDWMAIATLIISSMSPITDLVRTIRAGADKRAAHQSEAAFRDSFFHIAESASEILIQLGKLENVAIENQQRKLANGMNELPRFGALALDLNADEHTRFSNHIQKLEASCSALRLWARSATVAASRHTSQHHEGIANELPSLVDELNQMLLNEKSFNAQTASIKQALERIERAFSGLRRSN